MGANLVLRPAYELSYAVARRGVESLPPIQPPDDLRSFLYVVNLPPQGFEVAHRVLEADGGFRQRVAMDADESTLGRTAYLWLVRPPGWQAEFEMLEGGTGSRDGIDDLEPQSLLIKSLDEETNRLQQDQEAHVHGNSFNGHFEGVANEGVVEKELSSLKGLVDRLSTERRIAPGEEFAADRDSAHYAAPAFDADMYAIQHDLDATRRELEAARQEREAAVRQHTLALSRQLELEKDLSRAREDRAAVEREHGEVDAALVDAKEALVRTETLRANLELERSQLLNQIDGLADENKALSQQVNRVSEEKAVEAKALESELNTLKLDFDKVEGERSELAERLPGIQAELGETVAILDRAETQAAEARALGEALTEEKIDLASRLADTEAMLETVRAQLNAVKADYQRTIAEYETVMGQRNDLNNEVDELHAGLTEALNDLALARSLNDKDRDKLRSTRQQRDEFRIAIGALEEEKQGLESQLAAAIAERSTVAERSAQVRDQLDKSNADFAELTQANDQVVADLAKMRDERRLLVRERDTLRGELKDSADQTADLEGQRDELLRQIGQLGEENEGIQGQLVESDRLRAEASEASGNALSEVAQQLSRVETERNRLERELRSAENRLIEAFATFEAANKEAAARVRDEVDGIPEADGADLKADLSSSALRPSPVASRSPKSRKIGAKEREVSAVRKPAPSVEADDVDMFLRNAEPSEEPDSVEVSSDPAEKVASPVWNFSPRTTAESDILTNAEVNVDTDNEASVGQGSSSLVAGDLNPFQTYEPGEAEPLDFPGFQSRPSLGFGAELDSSSNAVSDTSSMSVHSSGPLAAGSGSFDDDDDLDAIGELISRTVTDFDPTKLADYSPTESAENTNWPAGASGASGRPTSGPPSVFDIGDDETFRADTSLGVNSGAVSAVGAGSVGGRRQVDLPAGLTDDVEIARHVVSCPDVVLLVDGDSVAKMGWPSLPVPQQRDALVSYLGDLATDTGASPDVVFDGRIGEEQSLPAGRNVRIRLSTPPTEPGAALDELVDAYPEHWPIAVISDDSNLARSASSRGATVLSNGQLLDLFISQ